MSSYSSSSFDSNLKPREKLSRFGIKYLTDLELLSLLLGTGRGQEDVYALSQRIFKESGGLRGLGYVTYDDLCAIKGIGQVKASRILAGIELGLRVKQTLQSSIPHPPTLDPEQQWINQSRKLWIHQTWTVLATPNASFDEALTLSLEHGLQDSHLF